MRTLDEVKRDIAAAVDDARDQILSIGETIWKNPESGYREVKTSKLAVGTLRDLGLTVRTPLALTGYRADLDSGKPGPCLAILGEMDSLVLPTHPDADPVTGAVHACGHNSHTAALLGAAIALKKSNALREFSGKVALIGSPAEECIEIDYRAKLIEEGKIRFLGGKQELIRCGAFDDVDLAYMLHVGGWCAWNGSGFLIKQVRFHGKSVHAANPSAGRNAMNALTLAQSALAMMRETFLPRDLMHGIITKAGDAMNIIPDLAVMEYQLRSDSGERLRSLSDIFDRAVSHAAQAVACTAEIQTFPGYMPLMNDTALFELYRTEAKHSFHADVGDLFYNPGSTDMGDVSAIVPALHGGFPGSEGMAHGTSFRIANPEQAYLGNAKLLAFMAADLLYGDAASGKAIAARKTEKMSIPDYLAMLESLRGDSK